MAQSRNGGGSRPRKPRGPSKEVQDARRPKDIPINDKKDPRHSSMSQNEKERVLVEMRRRVVEAYEYWEPTHEAGREDVNKSYVDQWDPEVRRRRQAEMRPVISVNGIPQYINNTVAAGQRNTIGVKYVQAGGLEESSPGAIDKQITLSYAQIMSGFARKIEMQSNADTKYIRALQHAVEAGIGWLRVDIHPDMSDPFANEIWLEHVRNRWSVLADPRAVQPDLSDMKFAFVHEMISVAEFAARYPNFYKEGTHPLNDAGGFAGVVGQQQQWWGNEDGVRIFDYYRKEVIDREYVLLIHPETRERLPLRTDEVSNIIDELKERGFEEKGRMKYPTPEVRILRTTRGHVLEEDHHWPGMRIPLVPCVGRQIDFQDSTMFLSQVRYAIEPQEMRNVWASAATEKIMQSPKNPWILPSSALSDDTIRQNWENADEQNPYFLEWDDSENPSQPPFRNNDATMPTSELQMAGFFTNMMQEAMGIYQANLGQRSNETSGVAIQRRQDAGAAAQIGFLFSQAGMVRSVGDILRELIPKVYNDDRLVTIINDEGEDIRFHINHYITDRETGKKTLINSLNLARYDLRVSVGPSSVAQREEFAEVMKVLVGNNPQLMQVGGDLIIRALNIPYGDVLAKRWRTMVLPPSALTEEERRMMPPREPTPEEVIAKEKVNLEQKELQVRNVELEAAKVKADAETKIAQLKLAEANETFRGNLAQGLAENGNGLQDIDREELEKLMEPIVKRLMAQFARERRR